MPRTPRVAPGGIVYHVLNRAVARAQIFDTDADYSAFENVLEETLKLIPLRLCAYCVMPNHWHLVLWPQKYKELAAFMQRLTLTHVRRWQAFRKLAGSGHLYQGRYKSFPVQHDDHFLKLVRYVERNALQAGLVQRAENWRWCSLWRRLRSNQADTSMLSEWPVEQPPHWVKLVNEPFGQKEMSSIKECLQRGRPFGNHNWEHLVAGQLGLESLYRSRGRPRKSIP